MLKEQTFFGLNSWKCFNEQLVSAKSIENFKVKQILEENKKGYIVLFNQKQLENGQITVTCYKKHSTSILKFIIIGKFPIPIYKNFKNEVNQIINQTSLLEEVIGKPEFTKYNLQRKLYFNKE